MLDICNNVSKTLDLKFNAKKCTALRIGKRFKVKCCNLMIESQSIDFVDEIKYLGIFIRSASNFSRSFCNSKMKLYRSFNAIYSKAFSASENVIVDLFKSYCLPLLLYACEAVCPSKSDINNYNKLLFTVFSKIFKTYDKDVISEVRTCFNLHNMDVIINRLHVNFTTRYFKKKLDFGDVVYFINNAYNA